MWSEPVFTAHTCPDSASPGVSICQEPWRQVTPIPANGLKGPRCPRLAWAQGPADFAPNGLWSRSGACLRCLQKLTQGATAPLFSALEGKWLTRVWKGLFEAGKAHRGWAGVELITTAAGEAGSVKSEKDSVKSMKSLGTLSHDAAKGEGSFNPEFISLNSEVLAAAQELLFLSFSGEQASS